jgi:hypothetical protein
MLAARDKAKCKAKRAVYPSWNEIHSSLPIGEVQCTVDILALSLFVLHTPTRHGPSQHDSTVGGRARKPSTHQLVGPHSRSLFCFQLRKSGPHADGRLEVLHARTPTEYAMALE